MLVLTRRLKHALDVTVQCPHDVSGILERDKLAAARQGDWFIERSFPAALSLHAAA
jgi:hypothetical protein